MAYGQPGDSLDEIVSVMMEPKTGNRLQPPQEVRILNAQVEQHFKCIHCTPTLQKKKKKSTIYAKHREGIGNSDPLFLIKVP